jgi:hypothetical protein
MVVKVSGFSAVVNKNLHGFDQFCIFISALHNRFVRVESCPDSNTGIVAVQITGDALSTYHELSNIGTEGITNRFYGCSTIFMNPQMNQDILIDIDISVIPRLETHPIKNEFFFIPKRLDTFVEVDLDVGFVHGAKGIRILIFCQDPKSFSVDPKRDDHSEKKT